MIYALDTNIISYLIKGIGDVEKHFDKAIIQDGNAYVIPPVVVFEIMRWLKDNPTPNLKLFGEMFDGLYENVKSESAMNPAAWELAADIYVDLKQKGRLIDDADILIAAYCIVNGYVLVTNNTRHFERIPDLHHTNWK